MARRQPTPRFPLTPARCRPHTRKADFTWRCGGRQDPEECSISVNRGLCQKSSACVKLRGFSKKLENHVAALSLYFMYYNYVRIHSPVVRSRPRASKQPASPISSCAVLAADPFVGSWKLNVEKFDLGVLAHPRAGVSLIKTPGRDMYLLRQLSSAKMRSSICKFRSSSTEQHTRDFLETEGPLSFQRRSTTPPTNSYSQIKKPVWLHRYFGTRYRRKVTL